MMKRFLSVISACCLALGCGAATPAIAGETIKMSTTTSTQDSGLLDYLLPKFTADTGITVQVIAKGTGAALRDGMDGNVDVVFVHDPAREVKFVKEGYGTKRYEVMHNDFVLVGPASDPAGIKGLKKIDDALKAIASKNAPFISRGDDSGTHAKELFLWKDAGVPLEKTSQKIMKGGKPAEVVFEAPKGEWYMSIGQGMGKTLMMAEEKKAYTLADRGTFVQQKYGKKPPSTLEIVTENDGPLLNPYGVIPVNPAKFPQAKFDAAQKFAEWLVSEAGQKHIAAYTLQGKQLFFPDALPQK